MSSQQQEPLNSYQQASPAVILYDANVMVDMDPDKIHGFLVLLQGDETLAFMALTDGNILDACVGAPTARREGARYQIARQAKQALAASVDSSDAIAPLAVLTYKKSLSIVQDHYARISKTFFCCRCFVQGRIKQKATQDIKEAFRMLEEAVAASSR